MLLFVDVHVIMARAVDAAAVAITVLLLVLHLWLFAGGVGSGISMHVLS